MSRSLLKLLLSRVLAPPARTNAHVAVSAHRYTNTHTHTHSPAASIDRKDRGQKGEHPCKSNHSAHGGIPRLYDLTFCSANNAPVGSVTTAMVPSRSCGEGDKMTLPPSASTRAAADTGSSTPM